MTLSALITYLEDIKAMYGDVGVCTFDDNVIDEQQEWIPLTTEDVFFEDGIVKVMV
jgi:hypothetical protein